MFSKSSGDDKKKKSIGFKISIFLILIFAPILLVMLVFAPLAAKKARERLIAAYKLPPNYRMADFENVMEILRNDYEFQFYFYALKGKIAPIVEEAWSILDNNRNSESLLEEIVALMGQVKSNGLLFLHLDYTEEFFQNPQEFPQLSDVYWNFLAEEFKLTILGVCYKTTYDNGFVFHWDKDSKEAAQKLRTIVIKLNSLQEK